MAKGDYLLAALDMDGTLLNTDHAFTPYTVAALTRAAEAGKVIALCTGRCLSELWRHFETVPAVGYAISENGGCLYDVKAGKVLSQLTIAPDRAMAILEKLRGYDACVQCFMNGQSYIESAGGEALKPYHVYDFAPVFEEGSVFVAGVLALAREKGHVEKIDVYFADPGDKAAFWREIADRDLFIADSLGYGCEISPREATKSGGLIRLCEHLGIDLSRSLAIGDGGNDLDLMRAAGMSIAMGNADPRVLAAADATTEDCDHDGAARAVLRYMLGEDT